LLLILKKRSNFDEASNKVDAFALRMVYENMVRRMQMRIRQVKEHCKKFDLDSALAMHPKLVLFALEL